MQWTREMFFSGLRKAYIQCGFSFGDFADRIFQFSNKQIVLRNQIQFLSQMKYKCFVTIAHGMIKWCTTKFIFCIHIRSFLDQKFRDILMLQIDLVLTKYILYIINVQYMMSSKENYLFSRLNAMVFFGRDSSHGHPHYCLPTKLPHLYALIKSLI